MHEIFVLNIDKHTLGCDDQLAQMGRGNVRGMIEGGNVRIHMYHSKSLRAAVMILDSFRTAILLAQPAELTSSHWAVTRSGQEVCACRTTTSCYVRAAVTTCDTQRDIHIDSF